MHVLFLSDNFPPETNAPATRLVEHARLWVREGHRVTVVTCAPNFPEGRVYPGYANRWYQRETLDGIEVVRVKSFIAPNRGKVLRILDYLSFMVCGSIAALFQDEPDVVVATSPQFFAAVGGWFVAALRKKPFVFELRDLWPASIKAVGAMKPSLALGLLERLELALYRRASRVVAVTEAFRTNLMARGIDAAKIDLVRNGVDLERYAPRPRDPELERRWQLAGKCVVGYLGTHGLAHALERVLDAAEILRGDPDVHFLFVGAGAARDGLVELARSKQLDNVSFHDGVSKDEMPRLWSLCDFGLVHLKNSELFATVVPSKIFECFGMGVPVLFCGPDGEAAQIIRSTGSGLVLPAEDPRALAEVVAGCSAAQRAALAAGARQAAPQFDRSANAARMLETFVRAAKTSAAVREQERGRPRRVA